MPTITAPIVAPTSGISDSVPITIASGAANGTPRIVRTTNAASPSISETVKAPIT